MHPSQEYLGSVWGFSFDKAVGNEIAKTLYN